MKHPQPKISRSAVQIVSMLIGFVASCGSTLIQDPADEVMSKEEAVRFFQELHEELLPTGMTNTDFEPRYWKISSEVELEGGRSLRCVFYDSSNRLHTLPIRRSFLVLSDESSRIIARTPEEFFHLTDKLSKELLSLGTESAFQPILEGLNLSSIPAQESKYLNSISIERHVVRIIKEGPFCYKYWNEPEIPVRIELIIGVEGCRSMSVDMPNKQPVTLRWNELKPRFLSGETLSQVFWDPELGWDFGPNYRIWEPGNDFLVSTGEFLKIIPGPDEVALFSRKGKELEGIRSVMLRGINRNIPALDHRGWFTTYAFASIKAVEFAIHLAQKDRQLAWEWALQGSYEMSGTEGEDCSGADWSFEQIDGIDIYTWKPHVENHYAPWETKSWRLEFDGEYLIRVTASW